MRRLALRADLSLVRRFAQIDLLNKFLRVPPSSAVTAPERYYMPQCYLLWLYAICYHQKGTEIPYGATTACTTAGSTSRAPRSPLPPSPPSPPPPLPLPPSPSVLIPLSLRLPPSPS
eukprot:1515082-Rhodomonas_salina.2